MKIWASYSRILGSPLLSSALVFAAVGLGGIFYRVSSYADAPHIESYNWSRHPKVLLVAEPISSSCSTCQFSLSGWTSRGLEAGLDVLVIAQKKSAALASLRALSSSRVSVVTDVDPTVIQRFASGDKISGAYVRNGHVMAIQRGGIPTAAFLNGGRAQEAQK